MNANALTINKKKILGELVTVVQYNSSIVHILGTNHLDPRYVTIVRELIEYVKPQVVGVELCRTRVGHRNMIAAQRREKPSEFNFKKIPKNLVPTAVGEKLRLMYAYGSVRYEESKEFRLNLLKYRRMKTYKLQKPSEAGRYSIGAELLVPFNNQVWHADHLESNYLSNSKTNYKILLLDRPVEETFAAIAQVLTPSQKALIKYYKEYFEDEFLTCENFEKTIMHRLWRRNRKLHVIFLQHRDLHMAKIIVNALTRNNIQNLVCIVGKSHLSGLLEALKKELEVD